MIQASKLRKDLKYRLGLLRGALLERIRQANELLAFSDKLEKLADNGSEPEGVEAALDELETLAGVHEEIKTG